MSTYSNIEILVREKQIEIWYHHRHYLSIGIQPGDRPFLMDARRYDEIDLVDNLPLSLNKLDVDLTVGERDIMGLVKNRTSKATTQRIEVSRAPVVPQQGETIPRVNEYVRDHILSEILDSLARYPHQTRKETVQETERIARTYKEGKYVVAGIRANLTRGTYGDSEKLIAQRRRQLQAEAREVTRSTGSSS